MKNPDPNELSIAAVERETGLSKDTLRVWERRYHFPVPGRDQYGERSYPPDQVEKLKLIKKLMDQGHRPGKLVGAAPDILHGLAAVRSQDDRNVPGLHEEREDLLPFISLCTAHSVDELRRALTQHLLRSGMFRFIVDIAAPLTAMVGAHWADGHLAVFEEHLYTEALQAVLRNAIAAIPRNEAQPARPRILLTTIPNEMHGLGLLMAEAIFALEGAHCTSLGVQTPVTDLVQAARTQPADIVALSFSASARAPHVLEALADLRAGLPAATEIWVGGRCAALHRRPPAGVRVLELQEIPRALQEWRNKALT